MTNAKPEIRLQPPQDYLPYDDEAIQRSIVHHFEQAVERYPGKTAVKSRDKRITYQELNALANRLAHAILAQIEPGSEPVPFILGHDNPAIIALVGILKSGKAYVPISPSFPSARITQILEDLGARIVVTDNHNLPTTLAALPDAIPVEVLNLDQLDAALENQNPDVQILPSDLAYLLYTSGSTGAPKGVIHTHQDTMHNNIAQARDLFLSSSDRFALFISIGFEAARFSMHGALLNGATLCLYDIRSEGLGPLADWINREEISVVISTPSTFRHMLTLTAGKKRFPSVRAIVLGGEPVSSHDIALFRRHFPNESALVNVLGMTETGGIAHFIVDHHTDLTGYSVPAGYPIGERRLELVDESRQPVQNGQPGEILVHSSYLTPGYWNRPELNAEKFTTHPQNSQVRIFHTGDLGRLRPDGCLEYLGRKDSQIKIRGYRVEIAEIEAVLLEHPGVRNAAVIVADKENIPENKQLVAYVEPEANAGLSKERLHESLASKLPDYMLPAIIVFLEALPLTPTGKVNHRDLPSPEEVGQAQEQAYAPPSDAVEQGLVKIWEKVLKTRPIGVHDDYFELGGSSLIAAQLFTQIDKVFRRKLPLATLFQAPTIAQQAAILRQEDWVPDWSSLVTLRPSGDKPPLFFAAPVGGNVLSYRDLLHYLPPDQPCYGLQAIGLDGVQRPLRSMKAIVEHYIQEMQSVQPNGPYYLLGSSFGGLVVYEMAQQLHDMGQSVALVVMFDAYGPGYPSRPPGTSRMRRKLFRYMHRIDTHWSNLMYADWRGKITYVRVKGGKLVRRISRWAHARIDHLLHPVPRELKKVRAAQFGAAKKRKRHMRELRRFDGRLVLFRASRQPPGVLPNPTLGWETMVGDDIEVYEIDGHHTSIIYEPRVPTLSKKLNQVISEVQASERPRA